MIKAILIVILFGIAVFPQEGKSFQIARLKYNGGGDWYNDPSAEINLLNFIKNTTDIEVKPEYIFADLSTDEIFNYPFLFMTGHGNVVFSSEEASRLRIYLENGGFLYIDDDYGLDKAVRREMKKVFPDKDFIELPFNFPMYSIFYSFSSGPPKTHEHNGKPPQGFGIFIDKRLAVYYTYESNPSDGWADPEVHHDPESKREEALRFGTNLVIYALSE